MKIKSILLELPLWLLVTASFLGGIYAAATKLQGITWATPIILGIILGMYILGRIFETKKPEVNNENY